MSKRIRSLHTTVRPKLIWISPIMSRTCNILNCASLDSDIRISSASVGAASLENMLNPRPWSEKKATPLTCPETFSVIYVNQAIPSLFQYYSLHTDAGGCISAPCDYC